MDAPHEFGGEVTPSWVVVNQSQSPAFQAMVEWLAERVGPCLVLTGSPYPMNSARTRIKVGPVYKRASMSQRAKSWLQFVAWVSRELLSVPRDSFIIFSTNPPMMLHLGWLLKKLRGIRYGVLVWDIYPEHIVRMGLLRSSHPVVRLWLALNRRALAEAQLVLTISGSMARRLELQLPSQSDGALVRVIPNWADTMTIQPVEKSENPLARKYGQLDRVTVMYSGNIGATHELGGLLDAAERLSDDARVSFLVVGDGLGRAQLAAAVSERRLDNMRLVERQSWDTFPRMLALADISIVTQRPNTEDLSFPSKTYSAMAAGTAICALAPRDSDLAHLVDTSGIGIAVPPDDARALVDGIRFLLDNREILVQMKVRARQLAEQEYSFSVVRKAWLDCLVPIVREGVGQSTLRN